jgi:glucose/arabinose dehydrogenase
MQRLDLQAINLFKNIYLYMGSISCTLRKTGLIALFFSYSTLSYGQQTSSSGTGQRPLAPIKTPVSLRSDVLVEKVMDIGKLGVRLLKNEKTGEFWYSTFDGNVFKISNFDTPKATEHQVFSADDHGITRLQGAAFLNNTLFLCGNISANGGKGTKGRMVKYDLSKSKPQLTEVFNTVEYGTNATTFDHGWNALVISKDKKFIYVNSGARTDHGEVQDNKGAYPDARDNALTANVFRFPVNAENILLTTDEAKLKADGYLYAQGIRNAYDMTFDGKGNLFGVVHSGDYDQSEEMFWIRQGHHYGFPWQMSGIENPQQYPTWVPDPAKDPFISPGAHAWVVKYFRNDPNFPKIPDGVKFSAGVQNLGPDANEYRDIATGKIVDGDITGKAVSTFNAHSVPLGLVFDTKNALSNEFSGDGFVFRYGGGSDRPGTNLLRKTGKDLMHLDMSYNAAADNYYMKTTTIVNNFNAPVDAIMIDNKIYVMEHGTANSEGGRIWKITLPKK